MLGTITTAAVLACGAMLTGCAADTTTLDTADHGPVTAEQGDAPQTFEVRLGSDTTAEAAIPAIVEAGHAQLVAACASTRDATLRFLNPLASGDYADVACSAILDGGESIGQTSEALSSAEHIGQVQQKGVISTVACFAGGTAAFLGTRYGICPHGRTERDRTNCNDVGGWGGAGLGFVCALTFILPF
jgi:hypothetical protein